ncbi:hypothetical protein [Carboxylicivirga sp. RSCT41]|uniref:hypothetical protein n=1 Tax=Carboxylicivirga agarovorans TaxID=3417570 RepID=UPI003D33D505
MRTIVVVPDYDVSDLQPAIYSLGIKSAGINPLNPITPMAIRAWSKEKENRGFIGSRVLYNTNDLNK